MKKFLLIGLIVTAIGLCLSCAGSKPQNRLVPAVPLNKLIAQLPAENSVESSLVFSAISEYGENGMTQLLHWFASDDSALSIQSRYALSGLTLRLSEMDDEHIRQIRVKPIHSALSGKMENGKKSFLIAQLGIIGSDESVDLLSQFLHDYKLSEDAVNALTVIGGAEAGGALLEAIPDGSVRQQASIINALGQMKFAPAGPALIKLLDHEYPAVKEAALFAVSEIAPAEMLNPFKSLAQENPEDRNAFLTYLNNLSEVANNSTLTSECLEIIRNENQIYSESQRIQGLKILLHVDSETGLTEAVKIFSEENKKMRVAALNLVMNYNDKQTTQKWIAAAGTADDEKKAELAALFAEQGNLGSLPFLKQSLLTAPNEPAMNLYSAVIAIQNSHSLPELKHLLQRELSDAQLSRLFPVMLSQSLDSVLTPILSRYRELPAGSKKLLLRILTSRQETVLNDLVINDLQTPDDDLKRDLLKLLETTGRDRDLPQLMHFQMTTGSETAQKAAGRTIKAIYDRSDKKKDLNRIFRDLYVTTDETDKIRFFPFFRVLGGSEFLDILTEALEARDKSVQDLAVRILCDWQDAAAIDPLLRIAENHKNKTHQILAIRAILRLIRENAIPDERASIICKKLSGLRMRSEEQKLVISTLGEMQSAGAIELLGNFMHDQAVHYEAAVALYNILKSYNKDDWQRNDRVLAAIGALSPGSLKTQLTALRDQQTEMNKPPAGFVALFNGKDLTGWKGLVGDPVKRANMDSAELAHAQVEADKVMKQHWQVVDGILYFAGKGFDHICTAKDYGNFELLVDWKIEKGGDSGIYLRGAPQVQIWDPDQWKIGSGGLFNNQEQPSQPLMIADHPVGEWNTFRIKMIKKRVTIHLNDQLVVDNILLENYWERDKPVYPSGQIELQAHNSPLYFRNIFIKELPEEEPVFSGNLFNGMNLDGWTIIGNTDDSWNVADSVLFTDGDGGGWISTDTEYSDFILSLEFRLPEGGNSGVFIRAPHAGDPAYTGMEIQILDDYADKYNHLKAWQYTGSIYGLQAPAQRMSKKAGVWQTIEITCNGPSVKVVLNDSLITDAHLIDFMEEASAHPGIKRRKGFIGLQNHSTKIEYRKIKLTELR